MSPKDLYASYPRAREKFEGSVALLVVFLLVILIGAGSFVLDMGNLYRVRNELQNASDAAALAGASRLDGTEAGIEAAFEAAAQYVNENNRNGYPIAVSEEDVEYGEWLTGTHVFTPLDPEVENELARINAMKVYANRTEARNGNVDNFLAPILGQDTTPVRAAAVAVRGGLGVTCAFPLVVGECSLRTPATDGSCEYCMVMNDDTSDTAGWTSFGNALGNPQIAGAIIDVCYETDGETPAINGDGECAGPCHEVTAGSTLNIKNGVAMQDQDNGDKFDLSYCETVKRILWRNISYEMDTETGEMMVTGEVAPFKVKVPVIRAQDDSMGGCEVKFAGNQVVAGFATLEIYGVRCGNSDEEPYVADGYAADCGSLVTNEKYIAARLNCEMEEGGSGGGFFGTGSTHPRLVE